MESNSPITKFNPYSVTGGKLGMGKYVSIPFYAPIAGFRTASESSILSLELPFWLKIHHIMSDNLVMRFLVGEYSLQV